MSKLIYHTIKYITTKEPREENVLLQYWLGDASSVVEHLPVCTRPGFMHNNNKSLEHIAERTSQPNCERTYTSCFYRQRGTFLVVF